MPNHSRICIRDGNGKREHHCHRHHAFITQGRRVRLLWISQQYRHVHRSHDRPFLARCFCRLHVHFLLFFGSLSHRALMCLSGQDTLQGTRQERTYFIRPFHLAQRNSCRHQPTASVHSIRYDHQLRSHVCQADWHYLFYRIFLYTDGHRYGSIAVVLRKTGR